jgi:hypothetical protein
MIKCEPSPSLPYPVIALAVFHHAIEQWRIACGDSHFRYGHAAHATHAGDQDESRGRETGHPQLSVAVYRELVENLLSRWQECARLQGHELPAGHPVAPEVIHGGGPQQCHTLIIHHTDHIIAVSIVSESGKAFRRHSGTGIIVHHPASVRAHQVSSAPHVQHTRGPSLHRPRHRLEAVFMRHYPSQAAFPAHLPHGSRTVFVEPCGDHRRRIGGLFATSAIHPHHHLACGHPQRAVSRHQQRVDTRSRATWQRHLRHLIACLVNTVKPFVGAKEQIPVAHCCQAHDVVRAHHTPVVLSHAKNVDLIAVVATQSAGGGIPRVPLAVAHHGMYLCHRQLWPGSQRNV